MNRTVFLLVTLLCLYLSCTEKKQEEKILLENFPTPKEMHPRWSDLFTDKSEITPLETTSECLVGQIDKIKKFKGHYYISSSGGQSILHFNEKGKFVSVLSKQGQGPEEYQRIEDFDICETEGTTEIWISDNISLKVYDAADLSFKFKIPYSYVIHKMKIHSL